MNAGDLVRLKNKWNVWVIDSVEIEDDPKYSKAVLTWQGASFEIPILIFDACLKDGTLKCYSQNGR